MSEFENIDNQLPYNPGDVDIRQQRFTIRDIMEMITESDIELWREDSYQRKSVSWGIEQKSRLIESLIMRIPLPIFYFDGSEKPWKVIDGLHRLTTLYTFLKGKSFELQGLEYLKALEGKVFFDLPFQYVRIIQTATIEAYVINPGTPDRVKLNIFQRINTGGSSLNAQEIRNAYYRGKPAEFINNLARTKSFLDVIEGKISPSRMKDREVVLRFISFYVHLKYYKPPMEKFLNDSMETLYHYDDSLLDFLRQRFDFSMKACKEIFHENAFYILNIDGVRQSSNINIALFEIWTVNIALLERLTLRILMNNRHQILNSFIGLLQNVEFYKAIASGTSSKKAVYTRFAAIKHLLEDINYA